MNDTVDLRGYLFSHVCSIEPMRELSGEVSLFLPQNRYLNAKNLPLNRYGNGPFCKFKISTRLLDAGVYALTMADNKVRYVGECKSLSSRFNSGYGNISPKNCFKGGQETNCRLNALVSRTILDGDKIDLWFFKTANYKIIEQQLRADLRPEWNLM